MLDELLDRFNRTQKLQKKEKIMLHEEKLCRMTNNLNYKNKMRKNTKMQQKKLKITENKASRPKKVNGC